MVGTLPQPIAAFASVTTPRWRETTVITVSRVTRRFESRRVLDAVTLSAADGQVTGVVGPLGAGASTLLRVVVGLVRADFGTVHFDGSPLLGHPAPASVLGAFLGSEFVPERLTPRSYLAHVRSLAGAHRGRVGELLDLANLTHVPDQLVKDLSIAERQRLGIAATTVAHPQHLVLDEPLAGLEPGDVAWVRDLLRAHADAGGSVLLSSNHLDALAPLTDRLVEIDRGAVVREGTTASFLAPGTRRTYVESDDLSGALAAMTEQGWVVEPLGGGLVVLGSSPEEVGHLLFTTGPGATQVRELDRSGDRGTVHPADAVRAVRAARRNR